MTTYISGNWSISKGEYGIDHGTFWGLFHGSELVDWTRTLHAAKEIAAEAERVCNLPTMQDDPSIPY